jgi:hypothetical protein
MFCSAILAVAVALGAAIPPVPPTSPQAPADTKVIRVTEVRPGEVFPGDFASAYGYNLEATRVKEIWLVEGKAAFRLEIVEQTGHSILFRLPTWIPGGRWQVAVLTDHEMMIEQGVYLKVRSYHGLPTG